MPGAKLSEAVLDLALETLAKAGSLRLRVSGTSMVPTIFPGSTVRIRAASVVDVRLRDIVLMRTVGGVQLHRLISRRGANLITRGDHHTDNDQPSRTEDLLGVMEQVEQAPTFLSRLRTRVAMLRGATV